MLTGKEFWAEMERLYFAKSTESVETDDAMYDDMLCVLPPQAMGRYSFLMGEPWSHNARGEEIYAAFFANNGKYTARYMTEAEFNAG